MAILDTLTQLVTPLFLDPFEVPGLPSVRRFHNLIIHFPIVVMTFAALLEMLHLSKSLCQKFGWQTRDLAVVARRAFLAGWACMALAYTTGQISSMRDGLHLRDPAWLDANRGLASTVINHRGAASLAFAIATAWLILDRAVVRRLPPDCAAARVLRPLFVLATFAGIATAAHLGQAIQI
jgi:hypothetical protein